MRSDRSYEVKNPREVFRLLCEVGISMVGSCKSEGPIRRGGTGAEIYFAKGESFRFQHVSNIVISLSFYLRPFAPGCFPTSIRSFLLNLLMGADEKLPSPSLPWRAASSFAIVTVGTLSKLFLNVASRTRVHGLEGFLNLLDERRDASKRERGLITGTYPTLACVFLV